MLINRRITWAKTSLLFGQQVLLIRVIRFPQLGAAEFSDFCEALCDNKSVSKDYSHN